MTDGSVRLAYANAAGMRETQGRVSAMLGCELRAMYQKSDPEIVAHDHADARRWRAAAPRARVPLSQHGVLRWFRTSYMRTTSDEVLVENEDLTERRRNQAEIEAAERRCVASARGSPSCSSARRR